jgi:hypothetical protein
MPGKFIGCPSDHEADQLAVSPLLRRYLWVAL